MTDHDAGYSNRTVFSIENDALRYTWAGYSLFVIVSSFIGDTTILIASIKYRAFRLHKAIIVIIQHIAFSDLMVSATDILPRFVSTVANDWVLGSFLCYLTGYGRFFFNAASVLLLCALTSSKLLLLKYPLRFRTTTVKQAHIFCYVACWLVAAGLPASFLLVDMYDIHFSYKDYQCIYAATSDVWLWLKLLHAVFYVMIPTGFVVACTIFLLIVAKRFARRGQESLKLQGTMAIVLTAVVYCISFLPYVLFRIVESVVVKTDPDESQRIFLANFYRVVLSFVSLNTISNFFIYSLTVDSFRRFVLSRILPTRRSFSVTSSRTFTTDINNEGEWPY